MVIQISQGLVPDQCGEQVFQFFNFCTQDHHNITKAHDGEVKNQIGAAANSQ
ncbi:MAG TPA: hypothetical protein VFC34_00080 [Puia sp.]|nr:hypothetical protein [Puia sp.]